MAWVTPKTDWVAGNVPAASDFNRIESNINYIEQESHTPDNDLAAHLADTANPHQVKAEQVFALGGVPAGTAFPSAPANYTFFYRTDFKKLFIYLP